MNNKAEEYLRKLKIDKNEVVAYHFTNNDEGKMFNLIKIMTGFAKQQNKELIKANQKLVDIDRETTSQLIKSDKENKELIEKIENLEYYKTTSLGLWCTDRPDLISDPKKIMFQLK